MNFFYKIINILIIQIKKISKNTKERDILSLLFLLCFSIFLLITIFPLSKNFFKTILFPIISNFSNSIDILINHKVVHFSPINLDTFFYFSLYQPNKKSNYNFNYYTCYRDYSSSHKKIYYKKIIYNPFYRILFYSFYHSNQCILFLSYFVFNSFSYIINILYTFGFRKIFFNVTKY